MSHHETEIRSVANPDAVVSLEGYSTTPGTRIVTKPAADENQVVRPLLQVDDCSFQLGTLINSSLCLDAGTKVGDTIMQNNCNASSRSQRFEMVTGAASQTTIRTMDGRCMEMQGTASQFMLVKMKTCDGSPAQSFSLGGLQTAKILPPPTVVTTPVTQTLSTVSVTLHAEAVSSSAGIVLKDNSTWIAPREGGYIEYSVTAPYTGHYSFQVTYAAWLPGAAMDISVNGSPVGRMEMPLTGSMNSLVETTAFSLDFKAGLNTVRFAMPNSLIPYLTMSFASTYTNEKITRPGYVTPIAASGDTTVDIADINRVFRFALDKTLGTRAWRYPGNFAHLEYKLKVPKAGKYKVEVGYSSPSGGAIDLLLNPLALVNARAETPHASIPLTSTGAKMGTFLTASTITDLPAGEIRLDFFGHLHSFTDDWAVSAIKITPQ
jgi:hypothetical protein